MKIYKLPLVSLWEFAVFLDSHIGVGCDNMVFTEGWLLLWVFIKKSSSKLFGIHALKFIRWWKNILRTGK